MREYGVCAAEGVGGVGMKLDLPTIHARCVDEGDCLLWTGAKNDSGLPYGSHRGKTVNLRRLVWELSHGATIRPGYLACTSCGNASCLQPEHVVARTRKAHGALLSAAGSYSCPSRKARITAGRRKAANIKISLEIAREIRRSDDTAEVEAAKHGVSKNLVNGIRQGRFWAESVLSGSSVFNWGPA